MEMIGHEAPGINRKAFIINKMVKRMHDHLLVNGPDEHVHPIHRAKGDKVTGLSIICMVFATHDSRSIHRIFNFGLSTANGVPIMIIC
jgi:hypothetical protein